MIKCPSFRKVEKKLEETEHILASGESEEEDEDTDDEEMEEQLEKAR